MHLANQKIKNAWLEVHVFGSNTLGEAILLRLPSTHWVAIDSCAPRQYRQDGGHPIVGYLHNRGVRSLAFVMLTHPHYDHFWGMSQYFDDFKVDEFFVSGAITPTELAKILGKDIEEAYKQHDTAKQINYQELMDSYKKWRRHSGSSPRSTLNRTLVFPNSVSERPGFQIVAFSPSQNEIEKYYTEFDDVGNKIANQKLDYNKISIGLLFSSRHFNVVLGGDVEKDNWTTALKDFKSDLTSRLVKVSHHGSKNGYCKGLWDVFGANNNTIAVVTGYASSGLPAADTIDLIRKHSTEIYQTDVRDMKGSRAISHSSHATSKSAISQSFTLTNTDSRVADLNSPGTGWTSVKREADQVFGRCSFFFDSKGNLINKEIIGGRKL